MPAVREIFTLTTFTIPEGETFPPEQTYNLPEQWKTVFRPLDHSDLCLRGAIGRGVENPEKGIILTGWIWNDGETKSVASLEPWREHDSALSQLLKDPHQTVQLEMVAGDMALFASRLKSSRAEIITVDFPKGHRESLGDGIRKVDGMRLNRTVGGIDTANSAEAQAIIPYYSAPKYGWAVERAPREPDVDQAIWICAWRSEERETRYKENEKRTESGFPVGIYEDEDGNDEVEMPVEELFEKQLKDRGALAISKEHFQMHHSFPTVRK